MSTSDTSIELIKKRLEKLSLPNLKEEALKYGIKLSSEVHERWIDGIIDHLTRKGTLRDKNVQLPETFGKPCSPESASGNSKSSSAPEIFLFDTGTQKPTPAKPFMHADPLIIEQLNLQREQMSQQMKILEQMSQQQAMMQQFFATLTINQGSQRNLSHVNENIGSSFTQDPESHLFNRVPDISIAATGQAIKFLSSQIPNYAGTEDEDVEAWIKKIEDVAELHNLSPVVMLAAATSKVTKIARRWLELSTGEVNRPWVSFKLAIIDHFKKEVLFYSVMQKVEARRWNSTTETFRDYAMDKLALMQRLKLDEPDKIKLLINGINNFSIKCAAATLRVNSLNQFIREVQGIVESCGDSSKKFQYTNSKIVKSKDSTLNTVKPNASNYSSKEDSRSNGAKIQSHCVYCHSKDHDRDSCPKLKKKQQQDAKLKQQFNQPSPVATVEASTKDAEEESSPTVACVQNISRKLVITNPLIKISEICSKNCSLYALIDTGSPISFIISIL